MPEKETATLNIGKDVHHALKQEAARLSSNTPFRATITKLAEILITRALALPEQERYR